jgi:hypothetical protein
MEKLSIYGLPLNPHSALDSLAGPRASFCVSYATRVKLGRQLARVDSKIQASAGAAAPHQLARGLLDHLETAAMRLEWLLRDCGYVVSFTDDAPAELPQLPADEWLERYHSEQGDLFAAI